MLSRSTSTDYVFDGTKSGPYVESDPIHPLSAYGESKAAGRSRDRENRVHIPDSSYQLGLRGTWQEFPSDHAPPWCGTPRIARRRRPGRCAHFSRCHSRSHGTTVDSAPGAPGIYHMTAAGSTSWYGFACAILSAAMGPAGPRMQPIPGSDYPTPARRPANSVLDQRRNLPVPLGFSCHHGSSSSIRFLPACGWQHKPMRLIDEVSSNRDCRCAAPGTAGFRRHPGLLF